MPSRSRRHPLRALAAVADQAGTRVLVTFVKHNGRNIIVSPAPERDAPETHAPGDSQTAKDRLTRYAMLATSGLFSPTEVRTMHALAFGGLTLSQLAQCDGCSTQAIRARLQGNSKRQGGLLKKARRFWRDRELQDAGGAAYFKSSLNSKDDDGDDR